VLLDLTLPGKHGFELLCELRHDFAHLPVVVLSATEDRDTVMRAINDGAMGFIPKTSKTEVLIAALRLVFSGGVYLPPSAFSMHSGPMVTESRLPAPATRSPRDVGLTERQAQVLALLVQGKSNKLICRDLRLSEGTVKVHVSAILKALNVRSRAQAIAELSRRGVVIDGSTLNDAH